MAVLRIASEDSVAIKRSMATNASGMDLNAIDSSKPLSLQLFLNGLIGAGFFAEPRLEQIFR